MTLTFKVNNIDCANCAKKLERAIAKIKTIDDANLVFMTQRLIVQTEADEAKITEEILAQSKKTMPNAELIKL